MAIWVFVEHKEGKMKKAAAEVLYHAQKIAKNQSTEFAAVVFGKGIAGLKDQIAPFGIDKLYIADNELLEIYTTDAYTTVMTDLIKKEAPEYVFFGNSVITKDFVPRVAQRIAAGLVSDCTGISDDLTFKKPIYAGKGFTTLKFNEGKTNLVTIRPNSLGADVEAGAKDYVVENVAVNIAKDSIRTHIKEIIKRISGRPELTEAQIIVSGGRGMKGTENFALIEELADVLGAAVGASRAAVDSGWRNQEFQVGQTGKTVSPQIYIACGISGAIQHMAGMGSSKFIIAINKDPDANIFNLADYGIVDDLFKVVPLLTEEFRKVLAE